MRHLDWERLGIYTLLGILLGAFWWLVLKAIWAVAGW